MINHKWQNFLSLFCKLLLVLLLIISVFIIIIVNKTSTHTRGKLIAQNLKGSVDIYRDDFGVPHIIAHQDDLDAFFALGYVHAQDRFWQMEFQRRVVQGRLSEIFGQTTLDKDQYLRTWGFYYAAEEAWPALSATTKAIVQSYTDGVNAFIRQGHFPLPILLLHYQPQPWTVIDSIAWQKMMAWDLQNSWEQKLKNYLITQHLNTTQINVIFPPYPASAPTILSNKDLIQSRLIHHDASNTFNFKLSQMPNPTTSIQNTLEQTEMLRHELSFENTPGKGSNNWVVSGKFTTTGKPLLANDPHLKLQAPSVWYLAELKGPHLHVTGATIPGLPGIVIGHNDQIAWGVTNANPDAQELYILPPHTPLKVRTEIIRIKNKQDVILQVPISKQGPIISEVTAARKIGNHIALHWPALMQGDTTLQSMLEINYAKNWPDFVNALHHFITPSQNFVYADIQGNIGYYLPGKIPIRANGINPLPIPFNKRHEWLGYIPFERLPHVYNPPEGYIASANNKAVTENYPYPLTFHWETVPYRIIRIHQLLMQNQPLSMEKMQIIQNDAITLLWTDISPFLLKNTRPLNKQSKYALDKLRLWDGNSSLNSIAASIFAYWYRELAIMNPNFLQEYAAYPNPLFIKYQLQSNGSYCRSNATHNCNELLSQTLQKAIQKLMQDHGTHSKQWQWQYIHHAVFSELGLGTVNAINWIWNRDIASPGDNYTINAATFNLRNFNIIDSPSYRQIIDLSDLNKSVYILTPGQSNDPFNRHYADQMRLWRDGKYLKMSSDKVDWNKMKKLELIPAHKN